MSTEAFKADPDYGALEDYEIGILDSPKPPYQYDISSFDFEKNLDEISYKLLLINKGCAAPQLKASEISKEKSILIYEQGLRLLTPEISYYDIMQALEFEIEDLKAGIRRYEIQGCETCDKTFYYPRPEGGKYNPYMTYQRAKISALRTYRMLQGIRESCEIALPGGLNEKDYNKVELAQDYLIDIVLTYPKEISNKLIAEGKEEKLKEVKERCLSIFLKYLTQNLVEIDGDRKELGALDNPQTWRSNPFDKITGEFLPNNIKHLHHHLKIPNWCWNDTKKTFERFKPKIFIPKKVKNKEGEEIKVIHFNQDLFKAIKQTWGRIINDLLETEGFTERQETLEGKIIPIETDLYVQFIPFNNKPKLVHALKYQTRSVVVDIANWCNNGEKIEVTPELTQTLLEIMKAGGLTNQATARGFWRKAKRCVREYLENNEEIAYQAIEESGDSYLTENANEIRHEKINEKLAAYMKIRERRSRICPLCGEDLKLRTIIELQDYERDGLLKIELDKKGDIAKVWRSPG